MSSRDANQDAVNPTGDYLVRRAPKQPDASDYKADLARLRAARCQDFAAQLAALVGQIESEGFVVTVDQEQLDPRQPVTGNTAPVVCVRESRPMYMGPLAGVSLLIERVCYLSPRRPRAYSDDS